MIYLEYQISIDGKGIAFYDLDIWYVCVYSWKKCTKLKRICRKVIHVSTPFIIRSIYYVLNMSRMLVHMKEIPVFEVKLVHSGIFLFRVLMLN